MNFAEKTIRSVLGRTGRRILRIMLVTLCSGDPEVLTNIRLQHVILRTERYVKELSLFYFVLFKLALWLFQYALPPLSWKLRPFTRMSLEQRLKYLNEWQMSDFYFKRILFRLIATVCVSHLYSETPLLMKIGFGPSISHRLNHQSPCTLEKNQ